MYTMNAAGRQFTPEGQQDRIGTFFNGSFQCDDVEATFRQLSKRGVALTGGITHMDG